MVGAVAGAMGQEEVIVTYHVMGSTGEVLRPALFGAPPVRLLPVSTDLGSCSGPGMGTRWPGSSSLPENLTVQNELGPGFT